MKLGGPTCGLGRNSVVRSLANLSLILNNDIWSRETYTTDLINNKIRHVSNQFRVCRWYGLFICWGSSNTMALHGSWRLESPAIRLFAQKLIPVNSTRNIKIKHYWPHGRRPPSSLDSPREAFWCHCVMLQAKCWHNAGVLCAWARDQADIKMACGGSGRMIVRVISENYTSHTVSGCSKV